MATKLDILLAVELFPNATPRELVSKMQKKQVSYPTLIKHLQQLHKEGLIEKKDGVYQVSNAPKAHSLLWTLDFCFRNSLDYNIIVSETTASLVKDGLSKGEIQNAPFHAATLRKIVPVLSKNGFLVVDARKPLICRVVPSRFLEKLIDYFSGKKPAVKFLDFVDSIDETQVNSQLDKSFSAYKRLAKSQVAFDEIGFIHASLSLEGNTLTLPETEKLLKQNIPPTNKSFKDAQEVLDYKKALDTFAFSNQRVTLETVLEFHRTAMHSMAAGMGELRQQEVRIKGNPEYKIEGWKSVPKRLAEFFAQADAFERERKQAAHEWVADAAVLHSEFQRIHPFVDGNSRTARAIFTKLLIEKGFPLVKIPIGFFDQYMKHTKLSEKRNDAKFALLMKQIVLENLKQARKKIEFGE